MKKIAKFIVEKRIIFFVIFAALMVYSAFGIPKVKVEYSITKYLPAETDTAKALDIMENEFVTFGTGKILVRNITYERAAELADRIRAVEGVKSLPFENGEDYYRQSTALFNVTFTGDAGDETSVAAFHAVTGLLDGYDFAMPKELVNTFADDLAHDMVIILLLAAAVILLVLMFTSKSFAEILVFPIVFGAAALLNMGTNYWLGTISFVSQTVCIILQLALAIDYAIILCHRFTEEKEKNPGNPKEAMIAALGKAIPEIASSSLTTVSGLVALMFMQLRLGFDLGMVLAKSIICSMLTVFLLMPGLLLLFSKAMDKTRHRSFVPKIRVWGRGIVKIRYLIPVVFLGLFVLTGVMQGSVKYVYSENAIATSRPTATQKAIEECEQIFGHENALVVLLPVGDYEKQREVLDLVGSKEKVTSALGIANVEIKDGTYLTDKTTYRGLSELTGLPAAACLKAMRLYAVFAADYGALDPEAIESYEVRLIDLMNFLFEHDDSIRPLLDPETQKTYDFLKQTLRDAQKQLIGTNYTRLLFNIDGGVEDDETFALIRQLQSEVKAVYPEAIFAGSSMSAYDLNESFVADNLIITLLTAAFIFVILAFTFRSWSLPLFLVLTIQCAIFINFAWPVVWGANLFFFTYLIVSAIQMGATIDYAILITNRFRSLKETLPKRDAVIEALSESFPTILTSGSIMTVAAFLIGFISGSPLIASIGMYLGRGTLVSILCVMTLLPALLYLFDKFIDKTAIKRRHSNKRSARLQTAAAPAGAGGKIGTDSFPLPSGGEEVEKPEPPLSGGKAGGEEKPGPQEQEAGGEKNRTEGKDGETAERHKNV